MKHCYIYKITNLINGKIYIGQRQSKKLPEFDVYYYGSGTQIIRAIKKYGKENFKKDILEVCNIEELSGKEIHYISINNSDNRLLGYNITKGGEGFVFSPDRQKEISEAIKVKITGIKRTLEQKERQRERMLKLCSQTNYVHTRTGYAMNEEKRKFYSDLFKGKKRPETSVEWRANLSKALQGKKHPHQNVSIAKIDKETFKILKIYNSLQDAENENSAFVSCYRIAKRKSGTAGGFIWRYVKDLTDNELEDQILYSDHKLIVKNKLVSVTGYDKDGIQVSYYNSLKEFEKVNKISRNRIKRVNKKNKPINGVFYKLSPTLI